MQFYFNKPLFSKQLPGQMSYFAVGIFSYLYFSNLMNNKLKIFLVSIFILIFSYCFPLKFNVFYPAALGLIVIISAYSLPVFNNFGKYGDFTYGLYIFHFPVIQLFRHYNLFEKHNPYFMGVVVVLVSFLFVGTLFCIRAVYQPIRSIDGSFSGPKVSIFICGIS
jgi:peptidoglycan/LPS O-acetylase OafA/YrhL